MKRLFGPKGLVVIAPTKYYGYMVRGRMQGRLRRRSTSRSCGSNITRALGDVAAPLSNANFLKYGASTVPPLVLIDTAGVVRLYHPGTLAGPELAARIQAVLRK